MFMERLYVWNNPVQSAMKVKMNKKSIYRFSTPASWTAHCWRPASVSVRPGQAGGRCQGIAQIYFLFYFLVYLNTCLPDYSFHVSLFTILSLAASRLFRIHPFKLNLTTRSFPASNFLILGRRAQMSNI